jgi:cell division protein FtsL
VVHGRWRSPRRSTIPARGARRVTTTEAVIVAVVVAAVVAMAIWFVFLSHGGIGPGTV